MAQSICCGLLALVLILGIPGEGRAGLQVSLESENSLGGYLEEADGGQSPVPFRADRQGETLSIGVQFEDYSLSLIRGDRDLRVTADFRKGSPRSISENEKWFLNKLATELSSRTKRDNPFHARIVCVLRFLASWPAGMPLNVAMDSSTITIGEETVSREIMDQVRERSILETLALSEGPACADAQRGVQRTEDWTSLCDTIGNIAAACYPTSLWPPASNCESVLVGGRTCRGRCGTTCAGLCTGTRYTQDCLNHDRCVEVYGMTHKFCNFIFPACSDDCADAENCVDILGTWKLTHDWNCDGPNGTTRLYIYPDHTFKSGAVGHGKWAKSGRSVVLKYSNGCRATYTGTLGFGRLDLAGTMKCATSARNGCWQATKTNVPLPSMVSTAVGPSTSR